MIVFGIHCNFSIPLPVGLKARSNGFLFFTRQNVRARKIERFLEVLRTRSASDAQFVQSSYGLKCY